MVDLQTSSIMVASAGVLVAAVYYTITLRSANRTRQAQLFMNIYNQASTREFQAAWTRIISTKFRNYEEFNERCLKDQEFNDALNVVSFFYEGVGVLVKEGLLDIR